MNIIKITVAAVILLTFNTVAHSQQKITIHLIGDSTCAPCDGSSPQRGWGQMVENYLDSNIYVIKNWAKAGTSSKSYKTVGQWDKARINIKQGDVVLVQFGINDGNQEKPERYTTMKEFKDSLNSYIKEIKGYGAKVVLASPISKRYFVKGKYIPYPIRVGRAYQVQVVALENNLPFIDCFEFTGKWIKSLGDEKSKKYFCHYGPNNYRSERYRNGRKDDTHLNEAGADFVAKYMAKEVKKIL